MSDFIYVGLVFIVALIGYLTWLSKHFFSFAAFLYRAGGGDQGSEIFMVRVLIHNRERVSLTGDYFLEITLDDRDAELVDGTKKAFCGGAVLISHISDKKCWTLKFHTFPAEDTWTFEFGTTKACQVSISVTAIENRGNIFAGIAGAVGRSHMRIRRELREENTAVRDFYPTARRPTWLACFVIAVLSVSLYGLTSYFDPAAANNIRPELDWKTIWGGGLLVTGLALTFLVALRHQPSLISRGYSEETPIKPNDSPRSAT